MDDRSAALGMIETWGVPALIAAADAMAKTADVRVMPYEKADAGLVTVYVSGEVAAVKAAVEAGAEAARQVGKLISAHVIARPDDEVSAMLPVPPKPQPNPPVPAADDVAARYLDAMPVHKLRRLARSTPGFPLAGRQISKADKATLLRLLKDIIEQRR